MYSTLSNISKTPPEDDSSKYIGKYLYTPCCGTELRIFEGGMRHKGHFKKSIPGKPLVSVITTVYNRELVVERAMCSIFNQVYDNIEYIIIDGASKDGTLSIIRKYEDVVDYILSEEDNSLYQGINKGLQVAHGDYIIILNSDDWYTNDCLQKLVSAVLKSKAEVACGLAIETDANGLIVRHIGMMPFRENVRLRMPLRHETMLISKNLYNRVGLYDESYKIIADLKLTQKIYDETKAFVQLDQSVMFFRNNGLASRLDGNFILERKRLIQEQFQYINDSEAAVLANEFAGDVSPYLKIAMKYPMEDRLVKAIKEFLGLHGLFRPEKKTPELNFFEDY